MANYADYFSKVCYQPKWFIGDRVSGKYKKVPFVGTVGNDSLVSPDEGPRVSVFLDLPMQIGKTTVELIFVKPKDLKRLIPIEDPPEKKPVSKRKSAPVSNK